MRLLLICSAVLIFSIAIAAQRGGGNANPIASLKGVAVPQPDLTPYVADRQRLIVLGKALFWDQQVGSDGRTACASCHFHAGADHRLTNQIAGPASSTTAVRANTTLASGDFPFHAFADPNDNTSAATRERREVVGSAGVVLRAFAGLAGDSVESGADSATGLFTVGGVKVRQVTSRNAPSVINAVFNFRNFWDGRAANIFNGSTPFGARDARANVLANDGNALASEAVRLDRSSLASQAVGPPLNAQEMSYDGRAWMDLGRKLLAVTPLARQTVSSGDSVLGPWANAGAGLRADASYAALIRAVIDATGRVIVAAGEPSRAGEFNQMSYNFGLFFGIAVQAYEATLVSDDTPVDRFLAGDPTALNGVEQQGLNEFRAGASQCTQCHQGAELTAAGVTTAAAGNLQDPRALGLFRTAVSAIEDDPGAAGLDAFGSPLFPASPPGRAAGAFKASALRNVELTGPYFHTGGAATLEQVLEFYARNGDVPAGGNLVNGFGNIRLNAQERAQIVEFLKSLTDDRVRFERAPFDHPSLCVPAGYEATADHEVFALVPSVGGAGNRVPLQTFAEQLAGIGRDGSRAHTLQERCVP
jgi:cytochrome c peroxidase